MDPAMFDALVDVINRQTREANTDGFTIFHIGRKSLETPGKWCPSIGFCRWGWQAIKNEDGEYVPPLPNNGRDVALPICIDNLGEILPIELHSRNDMSHLTSEEKKFHIEELNVITIDASSNIPFDEIVVYPDVLDFDPTIGTYGGYILQLEGINH